MPFTLDTINEESIQEVFSLSGWAFDEHGNSYERILLLLNDVPIGEFRASIRSDVYDLVRPRPSHPQVGFFGDFKVPNSLMSKKINLKIIGVTNLRKEILFNKDFNVTDCERQFENNRLRNYNILDFLLDPNTGETPIFSPYELGSSCIRAKILETYHLHNGALPDFQLNLGNETHPYSYFARTEINELNTDQYFLDIGCGIRGMNDFFPNGVYLDAVHFKNVDVVSTLDALPFKDNLFSLVISQAVFEHLKNPFEMAREIHRVLKPGGKVLIDTAFMQPLHADPSHYFNMTSYGLKEVFKDFEIIDLGISLIRCLLMVTSCKLSPCCLL